MTTCAPPSTFVLTTPAHLDAVAHPLRIRVLWLLNDRPMTNQQMAAELGESPSRLHFHVRKLAAAGLIHIVETRPKGGVLEKLYGLVADRYVLDAGLLPSGPRAGGGQ